RVPPGVGGAERQKHRFCGADERSTVKTRPLSRGPHPIRMGAAFSVSQRRHALGGTHFCAQPRDRNSFPLIFPWGQNLALNRALGLAASHTLSAKFPCMCPVHPHMSAGRDFFIVCGMARFAFLAVIRAGWLGRTGGGGGKSRRNRPDGPRR